MTPANLPPLNFSKTQRLVLLIDLHPLLSLQNPTPYLRAVASVAARLLQFAPLSASLCAYKLFFSSLSPLRSDAVLPRHLSTPSLSFNHPAQTLASLSITLDSISTVIDLPNSPCCARASNAVSSLLQLIHDYAWETEKDTLLGEDDSIDGDFVKVPSNLVILLSAIGQSVSCSVDFLELREFDEVFCAVKEAFVVRDIHLCWIDVKSGELKIDGVDGKKIEREDNLVFLKDGIRKMGWGFCSSNLIVLGSSLLPFGLIYPKIGVSVGFMDFGGLDKRNCSGELSLEILDVNGMPLECKCCDLEFVNLKSLPCSIRSDDILNASESSDSQSLHGQDAFWVRLAKENMKLHVKSVHRYGECEKIGGSSEIVLVHECSQELGKSKKKSDVDFFADRVLEMLHGEMGGVASRSQPPTWQMFLSFLHTKGYWALVSLSSSNRDTFMGILKPFTTHLALLHILDADHVSNRGKSGSKLPKIDTRDTCDEDMSNSNRCFGSQTDTSTSDNCEPRGDGKRKKGQRRLYQEMTWNSFYKAAFEGSDIDLFELYIARHSEKSKKLKFLKCWMKQITKVDPYCLTALPGSKSMEELSACNAFLSEPSPVKEGASPVLKSETSETFFNNLSKKIQHSLESGMDLQNLAERVVKSSIHWLRHKFENENSSEGEQAMRNSDDSCREAVGSKLVELLLKAPKEMKKMHQDSDPCSSSENIVREYELQILLRIEILRSDVSGMMGESRKQKLLKQICSLLEIIQYLVAGGIHGHISLYDYVERTIKARYADELEDVVKKIYTKMDLLPFGDGDDDETPSLLFNSEDSNQSWRDKYDRNEKADANCINPSISTEGDSSQPLANHCKSPQEIGKDEHTRILNEARERRERARRFAPFISKARDLQRVWAPKQPKALKGKLDSLPNKSKRKDRQTPSYSVVCETPMMDKARKDHGNSSYTVSKALFQDK
ncbi:hypothetical protein Salat_0901000 [Sesamum alatum]|uniref:Treslin N-terminal domain-containing protein n=1 Tax=Sesamum alatum TaxID=300844 RepID=A0AAE2CRD3_9LAMI|nr:hypothetical protein Salat_0901000 [Sesamum alatum]